MDYHLEKAKNYTILAIIVIIVTMFINHVRFIMDKKQRTMDKKQIAVQNCGNIDVVNRLKSLNKN